MPEIDHVRGITGHPELAGPPYNPPSASVPVPPWELLHEGVVIPGNPANKPKYFVEVTSPYNDDVVAHDDDYEEDDEDDEEE